VRSVLGELLDRREEVGDVVVDMEAGLEHLSRGTTRHVDVLLAIAEPYFRSMETARRIYGLAEELGIPRVRLLANKVRDREEAESLASYAERHGLTVAGQVEYDEAVLRADRAGRALLDHADGGSGAVRDITRLTDRLVDGRL
jgi:CO dehydrogenase maturation factor